MNYKLKEQIYDVSHTCLMCVMFCVVMFGVGFLVWFVNGILPPSDKEVVEMLSDTCTKEEFASTIKYKSRDVDTFDIRTIRNKCKYRKLLGDI